MVLSRLQPSFGEAWRSDATLRRQWLDRVWSHVQRLPDHQNELRAQVLQHVLREDWQENKINPDLLIAYLQLPRRAVFINRKRSEAVARGVSLRFNNTHP